MSRNSKKLFFTVSLVALIVLAFGAGVLISKKDQKTYANQTPVDTTNVLGASVSNEKVTLKVASIDQKNPESTDTQSLKKVSLKIEIDNHTPTVLQFSPGLDLKIVTEDSSEFIPTMKFVSSDEVLGGPIASGQKQNYEVSFELPADSVPSKLIYSPGQNTKSLEISLK